MKNRVAGFALLSFICFTLSCTDAGKNKAPESLIVGKESKKTESSKKKTKKKISTKDLSNEKKGKTRVLENRATDLYDFAQQKGYSTKYCFLIDMSIPGGRKRFFVYDLEENAVAMSGLVAHGCCNEDFIAHPRFSNASGSGCSSLGKYKIGEFYRGQYGKSYRLHGLDKTNSNAYSRAVVIHGFDCVPDEEIYPRVLCNSFGCAMVSYNFFDRLSRIISKSEKPILMWIYR
jgi:hypothetical protein